MNFTAIDFETANSYRGSVCAVGITVVEGGSVVRTDSCLVRPKEMRFDRINIRIHGIRPEMVKDAPTFDVVWRKWILPALDTGVLVAHNAGFDTSVMRYAFQDYGITCPELDYCCTYRMAKAALPDLASHRLPTVADALGIPLARHHDPQEDALAAAQIALHFCSRCNAGSLEEALRHLGLYQGRMWHGGWCACGKTPPRGPKAARKKRPARKAKAVSKPVLNAEFRGLVQGILSDGRVVQSEAEYLRAWLDDPARGARVASRGAPKQLKTILSQILEDDVLDEEEEILLRNVLAEFAKSPG